MTEKSNTWAVWGKYIRCELERQNEEIEKIKVKHDEDLSSLRDEFLKEEIKCIERDKELEKQVALLDKTIQFKSSLWGAIGASLPIILSMIIALVVWLITNFGG